MTEAHSTSWLQSLIPTSANWGVIAAELAVLFFLLAIVFGWFARRGRKRRIQAASELLADRDDMANTATQTMAMHLKALLSGQDPSDADLADYRKRTRKMIGALCQPWLEPSKGALRDAAHEILALRHTDLHQFAGILGSPLVKESEEQKAVLENTRQELTEVKKAEALRSKQLQEALTTIGTMVAEYGRKFEASTDSRTGQVLRALIYLQALDEGNDPERAKKIVDETLSEHLEALSDQEKDQAPPKPDSAAVAAAAAAEAAELSTELDAEAEMMAAMAEEAKIREDSISGSAAQLDEHFDDLEAIEPEVESPVVAPQPPSAPATEELVTDTGPAESEAVPEMPSTSGMDALDDIDALIAQAQNQIDEKMPAAVAKADDALQARSADANEPAKQPGASPEADIAAPEAPQPQPEPVQAAPAQAKPAATAVDEPVEERPVAGTRSSAPAEPDVVPEPVDMTSDDISPEDISGDTEAEDLDEIVDLDDVELPQKPGSAKNETDTRSIPDNNSAEDTFDLDLDDIDALLDAEIARHQNPEPGNKSDEEDLDLSKP